MRSYYSATIPEFLEEDKNSILGKLSRFHQFDLGELQRNSWIRQIDILKLVLAIFSEGQIYFEFSIPRMGKRVDNVIIIGNLILILEFKIGATTYDDSFKRQVIDYCLDLQNFHEGSHNKIFVPILISTIAIDEDCELNVTDNLYDVLCCNALGLEKVLNKCLNASLTTEEINVHEWENSRYKPTPTIIEAAQALYKGHDVKEISRSDAGAINLGLTTDCINHIIDFSKHNGRKSICFLTGVPGAGKTLAGLNLAIERQRIDKSEHAVFLSGNGPLVDVLHEALVRDSVKSAQENEIEFNRSEVKRQTNKFIQNIHKFRDESLERPTESPIDKVVVFDEAQRAWDLEQLNSFMKRKRGIENFGVSEPDFLISVLDRHEGYCAIVCLIGGGQEINTGEAGTSEWIRALKTKYHNWDVYYSSLIIENEDYVPESDLQKWLKENGKVEKSLHLSVSVRSFRSEKVSELVHSILDIDKEKSSQLLKEIASSFPIVLTRDLFKAKKWLRNNSKGNERIGVLASAGSKRLRPMSVDVNIEINAPNWFLNSIDDVRSSNFLEEVATEFSIQGLEIDYSCLVWDINLCFDDGSWSYRAFRGTKWQNINSEEGRLYLKNAYRVLMTRARQGMVIVVPNGDRDDWTRPESLYDANYEYLKSLGISEI